MKTTETAFFLDAKIKACQLKWTHAQIVKEKHEAAWSEEYEQVSELRSKAQAIHDELQQLQEEVNEFFFQIPKENQTVELLSLCESVLSEFNFQPSDRLNARDAFLSHFADEFDTLCDLHDQLMKEERFKEASELAEQRIRIVRFLCGGER
jgi:hypothetical protein